MTFNGLYRCSGCSVTFSDPTAWREVSTSAAATAPAPCLPESRSAYSALTGGPGLSTWGGVLPQLGEPIGYGHREEDLKEIHEAAARANKSKGRRR